MLVPGAGSTYVSNSLTPNGTGNQYFRMGIDWGGTLAQRTITIGSDVSVSPGTKYTLNSNCTTSGAMFTNVSSVSDRYVFKTLNAGSNPTGTFVFFAIQGAVRTFSSHTAPTSATAFANSTVRLTVTLSGVFNTGQSAYIRYHNGVGFGSATITQLTYLSNNDYYVDIPAVTNTFGSTITYYFFTSGSGLTISNSDADLYSINLLNNGGSNYSYTVNTFTTTGSGGNWSSTGTWLGGVAPSTGSNVILQHDATLDADVNLASLTINSGINFTASDASPRNLTLTRSASGSATTLTNSGTWNNGIGGSTLTLSGAPSSGDAIHSLSGTFNLNNVIINKTSGSNNVGANFGASCKLASGGKLTIGNGGYITSGGIVSDFYTGNGNTTLEFSNPGGYVVQPGDATWPSTNSPASITISGSSTITLNTARTLTSTLTVNSGSTLTTNGNLTLKSDASGIASIGNSSGSISGSYTVERYIPGGASRRRTRFLASPVVGGTELQWRNNGTNATGLGIQITGNGGASNSFDVSNNTNNPASAWTYTQGATVSSSGSNGSDWTGFTTGNMSLTNGQGYRVLVRGDRMTNLSPTPGDPINTTSTNTTISVTGTYPGSSVEVGTTRNATFSNGWNLIGNPYPSPINWSAVTKGSDVDASYWVYDPSGGTYASHNGSSGTATNLIASGQGFFVRRNSGTTDANGNITFAEASKTAGNGHFLGKSQVQEFEYIMKYDSNNFDRNLIVFDANYSDADDNFDTDKLSNTNINICTKNINGRRLSINSLKPIENEEKVIPIDVSYSVLAKYTLEFARMESLNNLEILLKDKYLNKTVIVTPELKYAFELTSDANSTGENRFEFIFRKSATGLNNELTSNNNNFIVFPNPANNVLNLSLTTTKEDNYSFTIFNQLGEMVNNGNLDFNAKRTHALNIENLSNGVYFIQVKNGKTAQTIKFIK